MAEKTLGEFWDQLAGFDWFYEMSDDPGVYRRGTRAQAEVREVAAQSEEHAALYKAWREYMCSGPAWGTEKKPCPERPER